MAQVRYMVLDVEESISFYVDCLGFELEQQFGPAMAILSKDDLRLWIAGPAASASKPMSNGEQPVPGGWSRFVLTVSDLVNLVESLRNQDVVFLNKIVEGPGGKQTLCKDPSGNVIELFEPKTDT